ncbi:WD40/YVTN/BNR-like repeat-containing protein [Chitinophaga jiangningensis]|nr:oxidoreductase [Chitinophaga jiangningensis]
MWTSTAAKAQLPVPVRTLSAGLPAKSLRGLQAVTDDIVWVSGTQGMVGRTANGGQSWKWSKVADSCDFRSIYAFDSLKAVVLSIGSPALLYMTTNGGQSWKKVYSNEDKDIFFDGLVFMNEQEGIAIGDPLKDNNGKEKFTVLRTHNGGLSWELDPMDARPAAQPGEAIFAASNTSLIALPNGQSLFVTGGSVSRIFFNNGTRNRVIRDNNYSVYPLPLIQGQNSTGTFSVAFRDQQNGIIVGGDYKNDTLRERNCFITSDGGKTWTAPAIPPSGYQSAVTWVNKNTLLATGTSGTHLSYDGGKTWAKIGSGYNAIMKARNGKLVYLAGKEIAVLQAE